MESEILIVNKESLTPKHKSEHEPYEYFKYEVTKCSDLKGCSVAIYDIPPQKSSYPYHYHAVNTEAFYIIKGTGMLETPEGNKEITTGDIIVCPPSEKGAHRIMNTSDTEVLTYLDFDTAHIPDIVHYPHSDKIGVMEHNQSSKFYKNETEVGYYEGE